jgi:hypothetical protein
MVNKYLILDNKMDFSYNNKKSTITHGKIVIGITITKLSLYL